MKNKIQKNNKGITLVALVVTIIVLMILAGITLTMVLGQNGIIGKAKQAKEASANADKATADGLNSLDQEAEDAIKGIKSQVGEYRDNGKSVSTSSNTAIKDDGGNTVTIPAGFKIASDSATKQEDGIVVEDKDGNQFVWIPVASISNYVRTDFGEYRTINNFDDFSETMPSDEQTSISTYHGYYIGRYEAGDSISTAGKTLRATGASVTNKVSIKKGQSPYNFVTRDQAQTIATGMKTAENYNATTKLCSSYAWDTTLNFIQNKISDYGKNSPQGNYDNTTFTYTDITGASQTKPLGTDVLIPTGETTPVCSIYDMAGNDNEWTTETCDEPDATATSRGSFFYSDYSKRSAGMRSQDATTDSFDSMGFRVTLYM